MTMITIRKSRPEDLDELMKIFDYARRFMQAHGNPNQWIDGYPSAELMLGQIEAGYCYLCVDENANVCGTFCFIYGDDPTYARIDDGDWLNDEPYGVIHRLATNGRQKGIADACFEWCFRQTNNIRIDTHHDNIVMQSIFTKHGFQRCGIIYTHNGTPRIAYQKMI